MTDRLRIAVYAIARDESQHVDRFMASVADADIVVVADTGSRDSTPQRLGQRGALVHSISIDPWRFDDARNAALALVPADVAVCISLDLDEVLQPGWRAALEAAWVLGTTRLRYPFVASWNADGTPGITFRNNRVHARAGYRWRLPIHEVVEWYGPGDERVADCDDFVVHHRPDEQKSRGSYLLLLEAAGREAPQDPRLSHYLGREYFYHGRHADCVRELQRCLDLPGNTWAAQRAEACRLIGKSLDALQQFDASPPWYWRATLERPEQREPWVDLAAALYHRGDYAGGYYAAGRALAISDRASDYFNEPGAWGAIPHDLLSNCAWRLGLRDVAAQSAAAAAMLQPDDDRLRGNAEFFARRDVAGPGDGSG